MARSRARRRSQVAAHSSSQKARVGARLESCCSQSRMAQAKGGLWSKPKSAWTQRTHSMELWVQVVWCAMQLPLSWRQNSQRRHELLLSRTTNRAVPIVTRLQQVPHIAQLN